MIHRGADNGQAQGDVDAICKVEQFKGNESLIVVHGNHRVKFTLGSLVKNRIRWPGTAQFGLRQSTSGCLQGRLDNARLFVAKKALFATMRVEPGHCNTRGGAAKIPLEGGMCLAYAGADFFGAK